MARTVAGSSVLVVNVIGASSWVEGRWRRRSVRLLYVIVGVVVGISGLSAPAYGDEERLRAAVRQLPGARETNVGYDRGKFQHWIDVDGDCQDTRAEVLIAESREGTTGACVVETGEWFSYYDRETWRDSSDVDIDHLVALAEAWGSGAKRWTRPTRKRFANDLQDRRALVAVTDNVNQSKGDRDPAEWMPQYGKCRYLREWVATKLRWSLKANRAEKLELVKLAGGCRNKSLRWTPARVVYR